MGADVLFDCELGPDGDADTAEPDGLPPITRVI